MLLSFIALAADPALQPIGPGTDLPFETVIAYGFEGQDRVRVVASTSKEDACETLMKTRALHGGHGWWI